MFCIEWTLFSTIWLSPRDKRDVSNNWNAMAHDVKPSLFGWYYDNAFQIVEHILLSSAYLLYYIGQNSINDRKRYLVDSIWLICS